MKTLPSEDLLTAYRGLSAKLGASPEEAEIFARCYLRADLRGMFTAGAAVVPYILELVRAELMRFGTPFEVVRETPAMALIDGHNGVGSVVATRAMDLAIAKAGAVGVGCVWIRAGGDFGMAANHALQAVEHGQVGIAMRNGTPRVAPWGGRDPFLGTNPIAVAVPAGDQRPPIVIDMSSGSFSVGRTVMAARDGKPMPSAHLVDGDGSYTDEATAIVVDPSDRESALDGGIVTLGYKGLSWSIIVELLSGLLSGTAASYVNDFEPSADRRWREGTFVMAIDVASLLPLDQFERDVDAFAAALTAVRPASGSDGPRVPGERAARLEAERSRSGVPVREEDWAAIVALADELDVPLPVTAR